MVRITIKELDDSDLKREQREDLGEEEKSKHEAVIIFHDSRSGKRWNRQRERGANKQRREKREQETKAEMSKRWGKSAWHGVKMGSKSFFG